MQRKWLAGLALGSALALPCTALSWNLDEKPPVQEKEKAKVEALKLGATVPETLSLPDMDGKLRSFKDYRGKVVVIHFWSDLCPAEKHADPVMKAMEEYYAKKDVVLVAINSNQNELGPKPERDADYSKLYPNLRKKIKEIGHTHQLLIDHGNVVSDLLGAKSTPHCYVLDKQGKIAYVGALDGGPSAPEKTYVRDAADQLLEGKPVAVAETKPYG